MQPMLQILHFGAILEKAYFWKPIFFSSIISLNINPDRFIILHKSGMYITLEKNTLSAPAEGIFFLSNETEGKLRKIFKTPDTNRLHFCQFKTKRFRRCLLTKCLPFPVSAILQKKKSLKWWLLEKIYIFKWECFLLGRFKVITSRIFQTRSQYIAMYYTKRGRKGSTQENAGHEIIVTHQFFFLPCRPCGRFLQNVRNLWDL